MKTISKALISVFVVLLIAFVGYCIFSSGNLFSEDTLDNFYQNRTPHLVSYEPDEQYVRPIGRTVFKDGIRWASFSGSGIEFNCMATHFDVLIHSDTSLQTSSHKPRIAVIVNDDVLFDEVLTEDEQNIHISLVDYSGSVNVRIIKQSESMFSSFGIGTIRINEKRKIRPTSDKPVKIEFIGDSITAGYGIDEENRYGYFTTATENFSKTYAYLTAKELNAQYSAVAFSGYGVLSGAVSGGQINSEATIFKHYDKAITNKSFENEELTVWDNTKFSPDFVVINLGTNDATYCRTNERRNAFVSEYEKLLDIVREKNPNAYIVCVLTDVNNSLFTSIETAVENFKENTGDERITSSILYFNMAENGTVIDGHPSALANQSGAENLTEIIRTILETGTYTAEESTTIVQ